MKSIESVDVFEDVEAGATVSMNIVGKCPAPSLEYSTDLDEWITFDFENPQTITLKNVGDKKIASKGNVMSLIDNSCESVTIPSRDCFYALFSECESLTEAPELPATKMSASQDGLLQISESTCATFIFHLFCLPWQTI